MGDVATAAEAQLRQWDEAGTDVDTLLEELGRRQKTILNDVSVAGSLTLVAPYDERIMGPLDGVKALGQRVFRRWNREAHGLLCGVAAEDVEERDMVRKALGAQPSRVLLASAVASALITIGLSPALAPVVGYIVAKRFLQPAYEEFCEYWGEHLDD